MRVVNSAQSAAVLVLAPWSGAAADRFDRRLVVHTQLGAAAIAAVLTAAATGRTTVPAVIGLARSCAASGWARRWR